MSDETNPFDELGIDPTDSAKELTAALRDRAERAHPDDRERIKTLWRKLTLNDDERVRLALRARPKHERVGSRSADELAERVPPRVGGLDAPTMTATIEDVLLDDADSDDPPDECGPPAAFERMRILDE